jgi:hypothetical protein
MGHLSLLPAFPGISWSVSDSKAKLFYRSRSDATVCTTAAVPGKRNGCLDRIN